MAVRHQLGRDAVSQAALFADFLHQPAAEIAAADDLVQHIGGVPVRVVALRPGLAEGHGALRHGGAADDERAVVDRPRLGDRDIGTARRIAGRQRAEYPVDKPGQLGRGDIADDADDQTLAAELPGGESGEVIAGDRRDA